MKLDKGPAFVRLFTLETSKEELLRINSFGLLRLGLAVAVLFQHALTLSGNGTLVYFGYFREADLGSSGVAGFFAISGFLLAGSAQRLSSHTFLIHRIFRLLPGLWFALVVSAFVIVPIASIYGSTDSEFSFVAGTESSLTYFLLNMGLFVFQDSIGNVYATNPYPLAVNGSLWTLAPEFICYVSLLGLAFITRRKDLAQKALLFLAVVSISVVWTIFENSSDATMNTIIYPALGLGLAFATGALMAFVVKQFPFRPSPVVTIPILGIWILLGASGPVATILLSIIIVYLGLSLTNSVASSIGRKTDISYGVYLFHFPVIQTIILCTTPTWTATASLTILPIISLTIVSPLAWVSWRFIEDPFIKRSRAGSKSKI
jgi:peptidoglycan/LPS O-acetylase OafA/YrhL